MADDKTTGSAERAFTEINGEHAGAIDFSIHIDIGDTSFSLIDRIDLLGVDGLSAPCG